MFEETFDVVFNKYVQTESFRLPLSLKELRLFCLKICCSLKEDSAQSEPGRLSRSQSAPDSSSPLSECTGSNQRSRNVPIGYNSLSKTFNILKIVGKGNFGRVFKAENKFDHRLFALKQIPITPREDLSKVLQEVENLSKAGKHKNIVKYLDCFLIQEEEMPSEDNTDENPEESYISYRESQDRETTSDSFINFQEDVSGCEMKEVLLSGEVQLGNCRRKIISITEPSHLADRPASAGYSRTLSCICIKMEFCDFTLDQLMTSLKTHKEDHPTVRDLFSKISIKPEFKDHKINAKFGVFSPLFITRQLLEGLYFIHSLGIVHRDLKPANIFIMKNGNVKIGDFGLSKDLSKESSLSRLYAAGTRFYMAPEFSNSHQAGNLLDEVFPSSDMFSFGMVLVKILGFLVLHDSEFWRLGDNIRRHSKKEIGDFLKQDFIEDLAVGTTQGNLSKSRRSIYLPVLLSFLETLLTSVLDIRPKKRLTASQAVQMAEDIFSEIFSGNDFFRPKIGAK